jgi:hypothetical protein
LFEDQSYVEPQIKNGAASSNLELTVFLENAVATQALCQGVVRCRPWRGEVLTGIFPRIPALSVLGSSLESCVNQKLGKNIFPNWRCTASTDKAMLPTGVSRDSR